VRIGVNWGSLDQDLLARLMDTNAARPNPWDAQSVMREALVTSALESAARAESLGLPGNAITLSAKVSNVRIWLRSTGHSPRAATIRFIWASPRRAWAARAS